MNIKKIIIRMGILLLLIVVFTCVYTFSSRYELAVQVALVTIFVLSFAGVLIMSAELKKSLKVSVYLYKNIMLTGGIIFLAVFSLALIVNFVPCFFDSGISMMDVYRVLAEFPKNFSYYAVFVLTVVFVLLSVSNISLMIHEGVRLQNALSVLIGVIYIGGTGAIYAMSYFLEKNLRLSYFGIGVHTLITMFLLLMLCYFECVFAGSAIIGYVASKHIPSYDKDYIIILGCSIDKKGGLLPLLKGRVNRAVRFAWEQEIATGKKLLYVPSGGQGPDEIMSEGSAMELYLLTKGAESDEIYPERESRNTYENAVFSKRIIDSLCPDAKIAFATTNYHILRSGIILRKAGIDAEGIAGDTKWYFWPNGFIREFFAILKMNIREHISIAVFMASVSILFALASFVI